MVYIYILSLTIANLLVAWLGPWFSPINAFFLIGLDLLLRDKLHEKWKNNYLALRMFGIIATSGAISYTVNQDTGIIAIASSVSFMAAMIIDSLIYHKLKHLPWWKKSNGSNMGGAAIDSILFPTIAFGILMPHIVALQFLCKIIGGVVWSFLLQRRFK